MLFAATIPGLEDVTIAEVKEKLGVSAKKITEGRVSFSDHSDAVNLRSISRLCLLLKRFRFGNEEDIYRRVRRIRFKIEEPFLVRCIRTGQHSFDSQTIAKNVGALIFECGYNVDLKNPKTTIIVDIVNELCIIGILLKDRINRRDYRIRINPASIDATVAYAMLRIGGYKKTDILVDPFCRDGVIPIEAALAGGKNVYGLDENPNSIKNADINARLAGVAVQLTKSDVGWLDTLFKEKSIDKIITSPPFVSKRRNEAEITKLYKDLFYHARYALKKDGSIVALLPKPELLIRCAKEYSFKLRKKKKIFIGKQRLFILLFQL